jgi:hypothetical protein
MPTKKNPLNLNALQLKTLTLMQELARIEGHNAPGEEPGHVEVFNMPSPHGDHFHLGPDAMVLSRDATGLTNQAAWTALERKGLLQSRYPMGVVLTPAGLAYETGLRDAIVHRAHH